MSTAKRLPTVPRPRTKPDGAPFTEDDKEFWETEANGGVLRYEPVAFPTTLFRAEHDEQGRVVVRDRVVVSERAADEARAEGWYGHPDEARDALDGVHRDIARAAAEAAAAAERMSDSARRDYKKRSAATDEHVTE